MTDVETQPKECTGEVGLLYGADRIAAFMGMTVRQIYHACEKNRLPVFRMGATICARRATLLQWIERQEQNGELPP